MNFLLNERNQNDRTGSRKDPGGTSGRAPGAGDRDRVQGAGETKKLLFSEMPSRILGT